MRLIKLLCAVSLTFTVLWCGCGKQREEKPSPPAASEQAPAPEHVVAMVNGTPLTWAEMEQRAMGFLKDDVETNHLIIPTNRLEDAKEHFRRKSINAFVFKTLLLEEATKQKITLTEADRNAGLKALAKTLQLRNWTTNDFFLKGPMDEATMRREFEDGMVIDKVLKLNVRNKLKISDKEVADAVAVLNATNELKRVRLEDIRKQLFAGSDFGDVARAISDCPSAKRNGDLGEITRGQLPKPLEDAAFALKVDEISPVVQTRAGFHLLKVTARTQHNEASGSLPQGAESIRVSQIHLKYIDINRKHITDAILKSKFNSGVDAYFKDLKSKAKIECFLYEDMFQ
ncbi:MAG: peptidylprolyl isomerase [Kiritimatiellae bacterium]|nr:peptidylprolyl isomerase [Kiritimatiellia bacterium]